MKKQSALTLVVMLLSFFTFSSFSGPGDQKKNSNTTSTTYGTESALVVPAGFSSSIVAENIGAARHIAVNRNGDIYAKLLQPKDGHGIVFIKHPGQSDQAITGFGNYGGTGIAIHDGYLYTSSNTTVYRYKLSNNEEVVNTGNPEIIVTDLIDRREHNSKSLAFDHEGNLYVNIGAYSNSCQEQDRVRGSMGITGCPILDSAGGIWKFRADKLNQTYKDGVRYATGIRNTVGLNWNNQSNSLYAMQMGRDQLHDLFPQIYNTKVSAEVPAECLYQLHYGANAGWPYIYYDQEQGKKMLAPEYGGDGVKEVTKYYIDPVATFPGHMAPMAILFYSGDQFPEHYKNGAFISFHGSWNRSPEKQAGYFVAFVPFENGKPSGKWEVFADNFAETENIITPNNAKYRPVGLAQAPDGSIYVSDDSRGAIFKITYNK